jgi:ELWxxDGT repeat protein
LIEYTNPLDEKNIDELTSAGDLAFFQADDGIHGAELWKSDGAGSGTRMVKDIKIGSEGSYPDNLIDVDGTLFFTADEVDYDSGLWKSDGTESGTVLVKDILGINEAIAVGSKLYFKYFDELWVSDGSDPGTYLIKNIHAFCMTDVNGHLYFVGEDSTYGRELWKTDGTEIGTVMIKDINPGFGSSVMDADLGTCEFAVMGDEVFFFADDGIHGHELWKSDGTEAGTVLVKDVHPGDFNSCYWGNGCSLTSVGDSLFFLNPTDYDDWQLWVSDGTGAGTQKIKEFDTTSYGMYQTTLIDVFGTLYLMGYDQIYGYELWRSDGTEAGTMMVQDIAPGIISSSPKMFRISGSILYFFADNGVHGRELWAMKVESELFSLHLPIIINK